MVKKINNLTNLDSYHWKTTVSGNYNVEIIIYLRSL